MTITKKEIQEYQALIKQDYGVDVSDDEAVEQITRLLDLFEFLYGDRIGLVPDAPPYQQQQ